MAEDKQLQVGIKSFVKKKKIKPKPPIQKVVPHEELPNVENEKEESVTNSKESDNSPKATDEHAQDTSPPPPPKKEKNQRKGARGPVSKKNKNLEYKVLGARIPVELKDILKKALHNELYKKYTQDQFVEQAIIKLLKAHKVKVPNKF